MNHTEAIKAIEAEQAREAELVDDLADELEQLKEQHRQVDEQIEAILRQKRAASDRELALGASRAALMAEGNRIAS